MFTGIIEEIGVIRSIRKNTHSAVIRIGADKILSDIHLGDSIAVNGICLTVTEFGKDYFCADMMHETMNRTSFAKIAIGSRVNLERAMAANSRFGGHIVSGHIDGIGKIIEITKDDNATWFRIETDKKILRYIVEKGSIAIDGISLTVARVSDSDFSVSVIPHTKENTNLSERKIGDSLNLENDCIGKYVEKLLQTPQSESKSEISMEFLLQNGF
ncbi:MAG: riboflavin synthase [Peptostreptococcaceae bacterium]|nr:riboflavin synthase [Peptostreptococcaceae bacterium]